MDRSTMTGLIRTSLSTAEQLHVIPIAESTCINQSNNNSSISRFRWGDSPISPKSGKSTKHVNCTAEQQHNSTNKTVNLNLSSSHINCDPRVFIDVQSKGFTSRIVKYENGARLNRSMSANNLYNKPGQFPIVHLKKSGLPYKATKQPVSMTRIAPPEKSTFYGNTLSGLLRSNSVLGLQKSDDNLSHENRPILHPPPNENDMAPTRSVLDVLKEISRKRINSDDLTNGDVTKKYCRNDVCAIDNLDAGTLQVNIPFESQNSSKQKRQREHFIIGSFQQNEFSKQNALTIQLNQTTQCSLEQMAKRRLCSYNNDISSSLSSSSFNSNKRKFNDKSCSINQPQMLNNINNDCEKRKAKLHCQQTEVHLAELKKTVDYNNTPITPLPDTPIVHQEDKEEDNALNVNELISIPSKCKVPGPILSTSSESIKDVQKPKITLFNKNYDEILDKELTTELKSDDDKLCSGIVFVKPKKTSAIVTGTKNPIIERAQKSKLALMLSGLRGELYQDSSVYEVNNTKSAPLLTHSDTQQVNGTTVVTKNIPSKSIDKSSVMANTSNINDAPCSVNNSSNILNGSIQQNAVENNVQSTVQPIITATTSVNTTPILGDFKLVSSKSETPCNVTNVLTPITSSTLSPLVGIKLTPQTASIEATINTISTPKLITDSGAFSTINQTRSALNSTPASLPTIGGFSFGLPLIKNTTTTSINSSNIVVSSSSNTTPPSQSSNVLSNAVVTTKIVETPNAGTVASFVFGNNEKLTSSPTNQSEEKSNVDNNIQLTSSTTFANSTTPMFSFGNTDVSKARNRITVIPSNNFLFVNANTTTATTTPTFCTAVTQKTTATSPNIVSTPSFNLGSEAKAAPHLINNFQFGNTNITSNNANSDVKSTPNNTFTFEASNSSKITPITHSSNNGIFSFNTSANNATTTSTVFAFGNNHTASKPLESLSQQKENSTALTSFGGSTSDKVPDASSIGGGFSFVSGASSSAAPLSTNMFNTSGATAISPNFSFSANLNQQNISTVPTKNFNNETIKSFNSNNVDAAGEHNTFGSLANSINNQQTSTFSFVPNVVNTENAPTSNVFKSSGFTFGANSMTNTSGISINKSPAVAPTTSFSFGGNGSTSTVPIKNTIDNNNTSATSFSFGNIATSVTNLPSNNSKHFNFGNQSATLGASGSVTTMPNLPTSTPAIFGAANNNAVSSTFNFDGNASANNIFAPPPGERIIRKATRRLQKS